MPKITRRSFIEMAAAIGATAAWGNPLGAASRTPWRERRDLFMEGVASGDPDSTSVLLWTRYSNKGTNAPVELQLEVAEDVDFKRVVVAATTHASPAADWTCRVLAGGLKPAHVYWYRFADKDGNGSRIGRTRTAPDSDDSRPVRFAFVSCQNVTQGAQSAYRRMIFEDERADPADRLAFVLHLGDFIYEIVWYPEDRPNGMYDRRIRDLVRYESGEKIADFHVPTTVDDYRAVYRAYLRDPDLQDARARWPFIAMWDNHEFSWQGWQSIQKAGKARPGQSIKVAANQAWWEYLPSRCKKVSGPSLESFNPPAVTNVAIEKLDENGLGDEPNNLAAINSLIGYRSYRYGKHLDLIITDQHSYRSADPFSDPSLGKLGGDEFINMFTEEGMKVLDGGRAYCGGHHPAEVRFRL